MPPTFIRLNDQLFDAGIASTRFDERLQRTVFEISPPQTSLFDQIVDYLDHQPDAPDRAYHSGEIGVAIAALCIRWGSSLSTLMDVDTLPHPSLVLRRRKAQDQSVSWIDAAEMERLDLEISTALARLTRLYYEDCDAYMRLLMKAYHYLPMPVRTSRSSSAVRQAQLNQMSEVGADDRNDGRVIANFAWRSASIERFHRGRNNPVPLMPHERRFTLNEERKLLRELSGNMLAVDRAFGRLHPLYTGDFPSPRDLAMPQQREHADANTPWAYPADWRLKETVSLAGR